MKRQAHVTAGEVTRAGAKMGAVVAVLFLLFGVALGFVSLQDMGTDEFGLQVLMILFFTMWVVVCGGMFIYFLRIASSRGAARDRAIATLEFDDEPGQSGDADRPRSK